MKPLNKPQQQASSNTMTYEQSLEKIERIKEAIAEATSKRNYNEAKILESYLEKHEKIHERLFSKRKAQLIKERLSELESEKLQRQAELVEQVIIRLNNIYDTYDRNYADLERRHMMNLENLKSRFNRPVFTNMKISSTIRNLCAAEKYYANVMKDFQTAAQIKKQIEQRISYEQEEFDRTNVSTVDAKVRDAINLYKSQQSTFAQRLLTEKNILKRDIKRKILGMENRYKKIIYGISGPASGERGVTINPDEKMDITTSFEKQIMETIDYEFSEFAKKLQAKYKSESVIVVHKGSRKNINGRASNIRQQRSSSTGPKSTSKNYKRNSSVSSNNNRNYKNQNSQNQNHVRVISNIKNKRSPRFPIKKSQRSIENSDDITEETLTDTDYDSEDEISSKDHIKVEDINFDKIKIDDIKDENEIDIKYMIKKKNLVIHSEYNSSRRKSQIKSSNVEKKPVQPPKKDQNAPRRIRRKRISEATSYEANNNPDTEKNKRNPRLDFAKKKNQDVLLNEVNDDDDIDIL